jgi:hypothetical protein
MASLGLSLISDAIHETRIDHARVQALAMHDDDHGGFPIRNGPI